VTPGRRTWAKPLMIANPGETRQYVRHPVAGAVDRVTTMVRLLRLARAACR
jgi:hypothetical protein